jgi:hypothetical protein
MKIRTKLAAGVCAVATLVAASASAATFNFAGGSLLGSNVGNPSAVFSDTTATDTLTAIAINTEQPPAPRLHQSSLGIGVNLGLGDVNQIDNIGDDEAIVFDMGGLYTATSIRLALLTFGDRYSIWGSNSASVASCTSGGLTCLTSVSSLLASGDNSGLDGLGFKTVNLSGSGNWSYFIATTAGGSGDGYRVKELTASVIPLPAAGWMLLAGLGGIAAMKRRRKAA